MRRYMSFPKSCKIQNLFEVSSKDIPVTKKKKKRIPYIINASNNYQLKYVFKQNAIIPHKFSNGER